MNTRIEALFAAIVACAIQAEAAIAFTEEFSAATISPNLVAPSEYKFGPNSTPAGSAQNPSGIRSYVTTVATDFNTVDFVFEISLRVSSGTATQTAFIGFGSGLPDPNFFFEP